MAMFYAFRLLSSFSFLAIFTSALVIFPEAFSDLQVHRSAPASAPQSALRSAAHLPQISLPLVIWHGLGDSFDGDGIKETAKAASDLFPGTYVKIIQLGDTGSADRRATFFGNVTEQVEQACIELAADNILGSAPAINALGFSQGGQFLRAYVERCNVPPVYNLITFGAQHNGISDFESCDSATDFVCQAANGLLKLGTWTASVQGGLVPAQYYRDPEDLDQYLDYSNFLADINNERSDKNSTYADNIARLNRLVMYMFSDDTTVVPKESSWFAEYNKTSHITTPLEQRPIYQEDWLGLRRLADKGGLVYDVLYGEHMHFSRKALEQVMKQYFAPVFLDEQGNVCDVSDSNGSIGDERQDL